ncbi:hypothetical protein O0L34_g18990 [Tuta absoluta]|nr:hypothetical protein O0L34_g18990 [Tuta absoluta]
MKGKKPVGFLPTPPPPAHPSPTPRRDASDRSDRQAVECPAREFVPGVTQSAASVVEFGSRSAALEQRDPRRRLRATDQPAASSSTAPTPKPRITIRTKDEFPPLTRESAPKRTAPAASALTKENLAALNAILAKDPPGTKPSGSTAPARVSIEAPSAAPRGPPPPQLGQHATPSVPAPATKTAPPVTEATATLDPPRVNIEEELEALTDSYAPEPSQQQDMQELMEGLFGLQPKIRPRPESFETTAEGPEKRPNLGDTPPKMQQPQTNLRPAKQGTWTNRSLGVLGTAFPVLPRPATPPFPLPAFASQSASAAFATEVPRKTMREEPSQAAGSLLSTTSYADFATQEKGASSPREPSGNEPVPTPEPRGPEPADEEAESAHERRNEAPPQTQNEADSKKYPPIVVEKLPHWTRHLAALKEALGFTPNARAYGTGLRFVPKLDNEFRTIQRYLIQAKEQEPQMAFYCFTPALERPTKVALRGLPRDTDLEEIKEELLKMGLTMRHGRTIPPKRGRPGCLFFLELDPATKDDLEQLWTTKEFLCLPGITFEAWRGRPGPSQCHRCQGFGHSSANCYRQQKCVRCAGDHAAADCPRPREQPPTCANCGKNHTAKDRRCPVLRRETRNRGQRIPPPLPNPPTDEAPGLRHDAPAFVPRQQAQQYRAAASLAPEANPATQRGAPAGALRRRPRGGRRRNKAGRTEGQEVMAPFQINLVDITPPPAQFADFADDEVVYLPTIAPAQDQRKTQRAAHEPRPQQPQEHQRIPLHPRQEGTKKLPRQQAGELIANSTEFHEAVEFGGNLRHVLACGLEDLVNSLDRWD